MPRHKLSEPIRNALRDFSSRTHVCLPARVEKYDHTQQRVEVKPLLRRAYADGVVEPMPVVVNVPLIWPRSGGAQMTFPVKKGDTVMIVMADRSIDRWLSQGGEVTPDDRRQHDLSDAIAVPGLIPFADFDGPVESSENNEDVLLRYAESKVRIKSDGDVEVEGSKNIEMTAGGSIVTIFENGNVEVQAANEVEVSSEKVTINAPVEINGDVTVSGDVVASGVSLVTHTHGGVATGGGNTGEPN